MVGEQSVTTGQSVMSEAELDQLFVAFRQAFSARDRDGLVALWSPDIRVWHSADDRSKNRDEYLEFIAALPKRDVEFVDIRREYFVNGFVQQHRAQMRFPDGNVASSSICLIFRAVNGVISRIDEYIAVKQM